MDETQNFQMTATDLRHNQPRGGFGVGKIEDGEGKWDDGERKMPMMVGDGDRLEVISVCLIFGFD